MEKLFYSYSLSGHRKLHAELMSQYTSIYVRPKKTSIFNHIRKLLGAEKVIFGMVDDNYLEFFLVTFIRLIQKKPTVGIFFRPQTCFKMKISSILKFVIFYFLAKLRNLKVIIYLPFFCDSRLKYVSSDFVMDHEMWHLDWNNKEPDYLSASRNKSKKRLLVIGLLSTHKGLKELLYLLENNKSFLNYFEITLAGKTSPDPDSIDLRAKVESYVTKNIDHFMDYSQVCALYNNTDFVWCYYDDKYDQSSGVFGHALQYGKTPIIRNSSFLSKIDDNYQLGSLILDIKFLKNYNFYEHIENKNSLTDYRALVMGWRSNYVKKLGLDESEVNIK